MGNGAFRFPIGLTWRFGTILLAAAAPFAFLVQLSPEHRAPTSTVIALSCIAIVYIGLRTLYRSRPWVLIASPCATLVILAALALATDATESPVVALLVLPLVFAASMLRPRYAAATYVAYVAAWVVLLVQTSLNGHVDGAKVAIVAVAHIIVAGFAAGAAYLLADARDAAELSAAVAAARSPEALAEAMESHLIGGDLVAVALATVVGSPPTLCDVLVDVGQNASHNGRTMRISASDSFARAEHEGVVVQRPSLSSPNFGSRVAALRGYVAQVVLPLRIGDRLVAVLVLCSSRPDAFPARRNARLLRRYAGLAESCEAYLRAREESARVGAAERAQEAGHRVAAAADLEELAIAAAETTREVLVADRTWLLVDDGRLLRTLAVDGDEAEPLTIDPSRGTSIAAATIASGGTTWIPDVSGLATALPLGVPTGCEAVLGVAIPGDDRARAAIVAEWDQPRILRPDERVMIANLADLIGLAWTRIETSNELTRRAERDGLTDLLERRAFQACLEEAAQGAARPVTLIQVDLDHLKHLNDHAGHHVGDAALIAVADVLRRVAPKGSVLGRLGGDEFAVLCVGLAPDDALQVAQRMVAGVRTLDLEGAAMGLSVSAGVAVAADRVEPARLAERADRAARTAKIQGRGIAVLYGANIVGPREVVHHDPAPDLEQHPDEWIMLAGRIATEWLDTFAATAVAVSWLAGDRLVAVSHADRGGKLLLGDDLRTVPYALADYPATERCIRRDAVLTCSLDDAGADEREAALLRDLGYSALLMAPLVRDHAPLGVVEVFDQRRRTFTAVEQRSALALARWAAEVLAELPTPNVRL